MNQGWQYEKLDDVCDVEYGTRVVQRRDGGTGYPVYGGGGATFAMDVFNREDRVVVSRFGMSQQCTRFVAGKFFLNDSGLTLAPKHPATLLPAFLNQWAFSVNDEIYALGKGTAQKNLDVPAFRGLQVPVPSLREQERIVAVLEDAFESIAIAKINGEKNLQNARALFESHLRSVFTQNPTRSDWYSAKLAELATVQSGSGFPTNHQGKVKGGIPFYKVSDMNITGNEREMKCENNSITEEVRRELGAFLFPAGSIIFPKIGGAIATNKKRLTTRECCVDNNVMGVIPKAGKIDSDFLYHFFLGHDLSSFANEAHLPSIKKTVVENWEICVPKALHEQQQIVARLDTFADQSQQLESVYQQKLAGLDALSKSLLHEAFAGRL